MTTVSFAQDWNVDSRTRIDISGDEGAKSTDQRVTLGTTWGGSDWGIHVSSSVNYELGSYLLDDASMGIYEAYASTNLFGMADMTIGRQALSYGSGALMSGRDWSADRTTWDGMTFDLGLSDMADITLGYASMNAGADSLGVNTDDVGNMHVNIAGSFSGWDVNVLYMTQTATDDAATGIDISGGLMGASISASMNTDFDGDEMTSYGLSYAVNDDMSVSVGMTSYGDGTDDGAGGMTSFNMAGTDMSGGDWSNGGLGYLNASDEDLSYGLSYNMGGISLSATMHNITNSVDEDHERSVTQIGIGYSLGDNANLGISYATDATEGGADDKYTWITLNVTP
jgi:hypothetical protein